MRRSAIISTVLGCAMLPVLGAGCTSQQEYDKLMKTNRSLEEQVVRLEDERDRAHASLETARARLSAAQQDMDGLKSRSGGLTSDVEKMRRDYEALMRRVAELQLGPLPEDLAAALEQLAADHPNMLSFDPKLGLLRFASDFTFDLGSTTLRGEVLQTVQSLASILNSGKASGFEVRIIGHTDNVPIEKPDTRAKHPTNLHLSAHRAISVRDALVSAGVEPVRCQIAGYGEHRPIVANGPKGAAANRRVEIFLIPMPTLAAPLTDTTTPIASPSRTTTVDPMK
jgi:chemotaxis protein MotB